ncbi:hypothetical protein EZ456_04235 [Pedobacter psychrodurus]|uniref:Uncharacterized protein n=1 Tax=Pedobacter psychrodurus TaxID=2530456 RepID=A0A4R0Q9N3_9SPHI|nr:hypothetical protein [Pedobacter psychrodurus]TCD28604.1 hypothetical protein EZ456_04235 [Pedobacter psychrodurus]
MKLGKSTTATVVLTVLLMLALLSVARYGRLMKADPERSVIGDKGTIVPAKVFLKDVGHGSTAVKEIVVIFDKSISIKKSFEVMVFAPERKLIGIPENGRNAFLHLSDGYVFQKSRDSDKFTSIFNNYTFFIDPPIKQAQFENKRIVFNSFDALKGFGKRITVSWK